jgi:hypothetical protein
MKYIKKFEMYENINFSQEMRKCVDYYQYIDIIGGKLANIIRNEIYPLLMDKKYDDASNIVRNFFKPSRIDPNDQRTVIFLDHDMILATINRLKANSGQPEPKFKSGNIEDINSIVEMKKCLKYKFYIDDIDAKSFEYIKTQIQPLIDIGEYDDAKQTVRNFYKPSRPIKSDEDDEYTHDPIFLGYDDAYRLINHAKRDREAYNL